jgi:uncharacterized protein (DUF2252 family)
VNVQACGDAHALDVGGYASPERRLGFDLNDFDETLPGPWEYDLKRLVSPFNEARCLQSGASEETATAASLSAWGLVSATYS